METKENSGKSTGCNKKLRAFSYLYVSSFIHKAQEAGMRITASNSVHASLSFPKTVTLSQVQEGVDSFMAEVARTVGVAQERLLYCGALFTRPKPHCHIVLRTPKSRKTGFSVSKMPEAQRQTLLNFWEQSTGGTASLTTVYDLPGVLEYFAGDKNAGRKGQVSLIITSNN